MYKLYYLYSMKLEKNVVLLHIFFERIYNLFHQVLVSRLVCNHVTDISKSFQDAVIVCDQFIWFARCLSDEQEEHCRKF